MARNSSKEQAGELATHRSHTKESLGYYDYGFGDLDDVTLRLGEIDGNDTDSKTQTERLQSFCNLIRQYLCSPANKQEEAFPTEAVERFVRAAVEQHEDLQALTNLKTTFAAIVRQRLDLDCSKNITATVAAVQDLVECNGSIVKRVPEQSNDATAWLPAFDSVNDAPTMLGLLTSFQRIRQTLRNRVKNKATQTFLSEWRAEKHRDAQRGEPDEERGG